MKKAERHYLDTSAYLCLLLGEDKSEELADVLQGVHLLSSVLLVLEATRNLLRLGREGILATNKLQSALVRLEEDMAGFTLRDLTLDLCTGLTMPAITTPRSLDLAHLRTALWFHQREPLTRFVSLDAQQNQAARELGLPL